MDTATMVEKMMKENTGRALMDSGDYYGRHWERNQKIDDFEETEPVIIDISEYDEELGDVLVEMNIYHYLKNYLQYDERTDEEFQKWMEENDYYGMHAAEKFGEIRGYEKVDTINTYNSDNILSQTLQFTLYMSGSDIYATDKIALQIHNGCDVRGGYTKPRIFIPHEIDYFLIAQHDLTIHDQKGKVNGYSDCAGYEWYDIDTDKVILDHENNKLYYEDYDNELEIMPMLEY